MTTVVCYILATAAAALWYRRYTEREARRSWAAYFRWVHKGDRNART